MPTWLGITAVIGGVLLLLLIRPNNWWECWNGEWLFNSDGVFRKMTLTRQLAVKCRSRDMKLEQSRRRFVWKSIRQICSDFYWCSVSAICGTVLEIHFWELWWVFSFIISALYCLKTLFSRHWGWQNTQILSSRVYMAWKSSLFKRWCIQPRQLPRYHDCGQVDANPVTHCLVTSISHPSKQIYVPKIWLIMWDSRNLIGLIELDSMTF